MGEQQQRRSVAERREQLIDAAIAVLASEGIGAATTRRITDEAGLALGAFHYAFHSKDDLLRAVIERFSRSVESVLQHAILEPDSTPEGLGRQIIRGFMSFVEETPETHLAQYEVTVHALRDPNLRPLAEAHYERMTDAVELVLEDQPGMPSGRARRDLASHLTAVMDGLVLHRVIDQDPEAAERRLMLFLATMPALIQEVQRQADDVLVITN